MWSWLSELNPNIVLPIVTTGLGWLWHKVRGDKKKDQRSVVDAVIDNLIHELLDKYSVGSGDVTSYLKTARAYIDKHAWDVLAKRGIPKNTLTKSLLDGAIERGTAYLSREMVLIRRRPQN